MIGVAILLAAGLLVGTSLIVKYWNKVVDFMKNVVNKLQAKFSLQEKVMGVAVAIRKVGNKFQNRTKHYSKNELGQWKETIVTYESEANEIPDEYKQYAKENEDYDLTHELELQLQEA